MMHRKLTDRQALFVREYLVDLNATQAAIRAGYARTRASQHGWRLKHNPGVAAQIDAAMADRARLEGITAERVLFELALLGFANIMDYFEAGEDGAARPDLSRLTRDQAAAITEVQVEAVGAAGREVRKVKIKLADKSRNLELIGRHLGLFPRAPAREKATGASEAGEAGETGGDRPLSDTERAQEILRLLAGGQADPIRG